MIIPLKRDANGVPEWAIVELHGDLKQSEQSNLKIHIGDLAFNKAGIATLLIGNHLLTGKITSLDKPIAVLKKKINCHSSDNLDSDREYIITAIVKKKLIFKTRPKPITVNVPKSIK